jgi:hypothetical protein
MAGDEQVGAIPFGIKAVLLLQDREANHLPQYGVRRVVRRGRLAGLRMRVMGPGNLVWVYVPGQRRVRLAPELKYDTVSTIPGAIWLFDELNGFDGKLDMFDFKLLGKKEMYVPYNSYRFLGAALEDVEKQPC